MPVSAATRAAARLPPDPHRQPPSPPGSGRPVEDTRARRAALRAAPVIGQAPRLEDVPVAGDERLAARVAYRAAPLAIVHVAGVRVADALAHGDLAGPCECGGRRGRHIAHLPVRVERGEVDRHVGTEVLEHPLAQLLDLTIRIVLARDQERRQLEPDVGLLLQVDQRVQHGLEVRLRELPVEILGERLEVHVRRIHVPVELAPRLLAHVAGRDGHRLDAALVAGLGHVDGVLVEDHRIVVGEGDAAAAEPLRRLGQPFGRRRVRQPVYLPRLADVPVLAELARQVAAGGAEREHRRARQEVIERLLLDGINTETRGAAITGQEHPFIAGLSDKTKASLTCSQFTEAGT